MSNKMDALYTQIKTNSSNMEMMKQLNRIAPVLQSEARNLPIEQIYKDLDKFEKGMDDIIVSGKIMDEVLNKNQGSCTVNNQVDQMLNQLKLEQINKIQNDLQPGFNTYQEVPQNVIFNQQQNTNLQR